MSGHALGSLADSLQASDLLTPEQLNQLRADLGERYADTRELGRELLRRGWLTPFQINQLARGRTNELILGPYVLLGLLGKGGMGQVYKAQHRLMNRIVALKLMRSDHQVDTDLVARFQREIRAAARLSHPNIVIAHDAGRAGDLYYFAMEYVEGADLYRLVKESGPLGVSQACEYARQALLGLQHAYEQGLVHRDIKPHNLMVAANSGVVKVLDYGLARLREDESGSSALTAQGYLMGTPDYIAPEQAEDFHRADIRSDIYSLGCTLYFLLTGKPPFPGGSPLDKLQRHREIAPAPVEALRPDVPRAVGAVVRTMMAKRPEDRYPIPAAAITALQPFCRCADDKHWTELPLKLLPVTPGSDALSTGIAADTADLPIPSPAGVPPAKSASAATDARRRTRLLVAAGIVLAAGVVVVVSQLVIIRLRGPDGKDTEIQVQPGSKVIIGPGNKVDITPPATRPLWPPMPEPPRTDSPLSALALVTCPAPLPGLKRWTVETVGHRGRIMDLRYSPDGRWLASAGEDGTVRLWDVASGQLVRIFSCYSGPVYFFHTLTVAWSPDSRLLAAPTGRDRTVVIWEAATGRRVHTLTGHTDYVCAAAWSPNGQNIASASHDGSVRLWDGKSGQHVKRYLGKGALYALDWSADGTRLAAGGSDNTVYVLDSATGQMIHRLSADGMIQRLTWSPKGPYLACLVRKKDVRCWDGRTGERRHTFHPEDKGFLQDIAWSPDGKELAAFVYNRLLCRWSVETGKLVRQHNVFHKGLLSVTWSSDGTKILAGADDGQIRWYDANTGKEPGWLRDAGTVITNAFDFGWSPDGKYLACSGEDGTIRLWEIASGLQVRRFGGNPNAAGTLAWSRDGKTLFAGSKSIADGAVRQWDSDSGKLLGRIEAHKPGAYVRIALSPDGKTLASVGTEDAINLWNAFTHKPLRTIQTEGSAVRKFVWSPDSKKIAAVDSQRRTVWVWQADTGTLLRSFKEKVELRDIAWSADGASLAFLEDGRLRFSNAATGQEEASLQSSLDLASLAVSPVGTAVACGDTDGRILLWDYKARKTLGTFFGHGEAAWLLAWSPDGKLLASSDKRAQTFVWDAASGRRLYALIPLGDGRGLGIGIDGHYSGPVEAVRYVVDTDDGQETLTAADFGKRYGWKNDPGRIR